MPMSPQESAGFDGMFCARQELILATMELNNLGLNQLKYLEKRRKFKTLEYLRHLRLRGNL